MASAELPLIVLLVIVSLAASCDAVVVVPSLPVSAELPLTVQLFSVSSGVIINDAAAKGEADCR